MVVEPRSWHVMHLKMYKVAESSCLDLIHELEQCAHSETETIALISNEWQIGIHQWQAVLRVTTMYWQCFPWKLAGIIHADSMVAVECANACISIYDKCPELEKHHPLAVIVFDTGGSLRASLETLVREHRPLRESQTCARAF